MNAPWRTCSAANEENICVVDDALAAAARSALTAFSALSHCCALDNRLRSTLSSTAAPDATAVVVAAATAAAALPLLTPVALTEKHSKQSPPAGRPNMHTANA